ncbi:YdbH domain-containing protein [Sphingomonas sabuli]|uniref:YdbH domain-containing protein n=1 Tax=Sphingomonas sabuli TaxID=2764186 RepID=A0A7G9L4H5_9SPHN|nr:YdbH domain-containing protein [Sphingomonas sabuli]QNM83524.1 YdbH domain-containing protein [Sphingomonas sabuli]
MAKGSDESGEVLVVESRARRTRRLISWIALGLVVLVAVALAIAWVQRRPIARNAIQNELAKRGVRAEFTLDRVGLRTQEISNLRIGDPANPDVTARNVRIQMRIKWNGSVDVYRIVARGMRLRGRVYPDGRVSWGELDKLLPPPSGKPFSLPDVAVDVADSSISLRTPWGPLGFAAQGVGNLTGGFKGRFVSSSPGLQTPTCTFSAFRGYGAIEIEARRPHVIGPITAGNLSCPKSNFSIARPRLELDAQFGEAFDSYDAKARLISSQVIAGVNGLAALNGTITIKGKPDDSRGHLEITAQKSRLSSIRADRTVLAGDYKLRLDSGELTLVGKYAANSASLDANLVNGFTGAMMAAKDTPIGPVAVNIARAVGRSAGNFDVAGKLRLVNFRGGGAIRIDDATATTATGGRVQVSGGKGITYYWPSGRIGIDGTIRTAGGGLPNGYLAISSTRSGGYSGVGRFRPYVINGNRLDLSDLRFQAEPNGMTRFAAVATVTGAFSSGQVRGLHVPITGRVGANGGLYVGERCTVVSWDSFSLRDVHLGATRLPICPTGPAILYQPAGGSLTFAAQVSNPRIAGRLGNSPLSVIADRLDFSGAKGFATTNLRARLGDPNSPVQITGARLDGTFAGAGISGSIRDGTAVIGNVPLRMTDINGRWNLHGSDLTIGGGLMVNHIAPEPLFYPLASDNVRFLLRNNLIKATASLRHPDSGTKVTDVTIDHSLNSGSGNALLDVPGLTFGEGLQPEELTRLTEGVVALVQGTITGQGRINWNRAGKVTSTGDFATANTNLAAPFGPVEGLSTNIHFTNLLGLETGPGQVATVRSINPGIIVQDGVIRYQLLPNQLVKIERGEWPFMGGKLILQETILNFGSDTPKRLTFELEGFNSQMFIDSLDFQGLEISGTFDGVLPMIFDDEGGRIVGGRLVSREPGGRFRYTGTKPDAGLVAGVAFDLLSDIRFRNMVIRLDGDLAGEFASRFTIEEISVGGEGGGLISSLVRGAFRNVPIKINLNIAGPFRALIQMAKGFKDPSAVIQPVLPFPLDAPGLVVESRTLRKEEDQERITPIDQIEATPTPPQPNE